MACLHQVNIASSTNVARREPFRHCRLLGDSSHLLAGMSQLFRILPNRRGTEARRGGVCTSLLWMCCLTFCSNSSLGRVGSGTLRPWGPRFFRGLGPAPEGAIKRTVASAPRCQDCNRRNCWPREHPQGSQDSGTTLSSFKKPAKAEQFTVSRGAGCPRAPAAGAFGCTTVSLAEKAG